MSSLRVLSCASRLARTSAMASRTMAISRANRSIRQFSAMRPLAEKYYTETHEWIELTSDNKSGSIGISEYAARLLGDIVFVELPQSGAELKAGDAMGAVESVKSASDLYIPVAGKVTEANSELETEPGLINDSPEEEGWIAKIELKDGEAKKVKELMKAEAYKKFVTVEE